MREITDTKLRMVLRLRRKRELKSLSKKYNGIATASAVEEYLGNFNSKEVKKHRVEICIKKLQKLFNKYNRAC